MILDLGCGKGMISNYLAKKDKNAVVYGVDISKENIAFAEKNKISENQIFEITDGKRMKFREDYFGEIYCYDVLEHINNVGLMVSEIKRVLKRDGLLHITVPSEESENELVGYNKDYFKQISHIRTFDKARLLNYLRKYGFQCINYKQYNSIEHLFWKINFKNGIKIINQTGETNKKIPGVLKFLLMMLSKDSIYSFYAEKNIFKKAIFSTYFIFSPLSYLLDRILINKKQKAVFILRK